MYARTLQEFELVSESNYIFQGRCQKPISQLLIKLIIVLLGMLMNKSKGKIPRPKKFPKNSTKDSCTCHKNHTNQLLQHKKEFTSYYTSRLAFQIAKVLEAETVIVCQFLPHEECM